MVVSDTLVSPALAAALEACGYTFEAFTNVRALVSIGAAQAPGLVVYVARAFDHECVNFFERLRAREDTAHVPVVVVSDAPITWRLRYDFEDMFGAVSIVDRTDIPSRLQRSIREALGAEVVEETLSEDTERALRSSTDAWQLGDVPSAVSFLERAVESAPGSYRTRYHLGLAHGRAGDPHRAIRELVKSIEMHDRYFPALKNLAVLYERVGLARNAQEMWQRAWYVAPDENTRKQIKNRILELLHRTMNDSADQEDR
jgi:tetratricopeptide (TPR) repeat protein